MKSANKKTVAQQELDTIDAIEAELEKLPPEEESDTLGAVLRRFAERTSGFESASFAYSDLEQDDYLGEQTLHHVVEELQFGHDLRL